MEYFAIVFVVAALSIAYFFISQNTGRQVKKELNALPKSHEIIDDIDLSIEGEIALHLDYIVIGKPGIYLITIIDRKGIITGDESQPKWKEMKKENVESFDNPTFLNVRKIQSVRRITDDYEANIPIYPLVVFHKKANLNDLFSESLIIKANSIKNYINSDAEILSEERVEEIVKKLRV